MSPLLPGGSKDNEKAMEFERWIQIDSEKEKKMFRVKNQEAVRTRTTTIIMIATPITRVSK